MNRLARSPLLALPGILFVMLTQAAPALRPSVEAAGNPQALQLDPVRAALMKAHFHEVITIQDAVIRGDLGAATPAASALARLPAPPGLPDSTAAHVTAMKAAASRAAAATTLGAVSTEVATMLSKCGDCHVSAGTRPAPALAPKAETAGVVGHMLAHQRAIDQMLQGLVLPSASLWREGAEALKVAPLHRERLPRDSALTREVIAAENRVHDMASAALAATDPAVRSRQYAQMLTTCAECHSTHRKVWGPSGDRPPRP